MSSRRARKHGAGEGPAKAETDFEGAPGTVTFGPGETTKTVVVRAIGDLIAGADETFELQLSGPSGATWSVSPRSGG